MSKSTIIRILGTAGFVCAGALVLADRIKLTSGREIVGRVDAETADRVSIRTTAGRVSFRRDQIVSIDRSGPSETAVAVAVDAVSRADLAGALAFLAGATLSPSDRVDIDGALVRHAPEWLRTRPPTSGDAERLSRYVNERTTSAPAALRMVLAQALAATGEYKGATLELARITPGLFTTNRQARTDAIGILENALRQQLEAGSATAGTESLQLLSRIAPERVTSTTAALLHTREAGRLAETGDYEGAIDILTRKVRPVAPATAWEETARVLATAERAGSEEQILAIYEKVEIAFAAGGVDRELSQIFERHVSTLVRKPDFEKAAQVTALFGRMDADAAAPLEHRVQFARKRAALDSRDSFGKYRLAVWAREVGLHSEARTLLNSVVNLPELRESATLQLRLMNSALERTEFDEVLRLFQARRYDAAKKAGEAFRRDYPRSTFAGRTAELVELSRFQGWRAGKVRPGEAEALRQSAERLMLQERWDEALDALNQLEVEYEGTEAASGAGKMRDMIAMKMPVQAVPLRPPVQGIGSAKGAPTIEERRLAEIRAMARSVAQQSLQTK